MVCGAAAICDIRPVAEATTPQVNTEFFFHCVFNRSRVNQISCGPIIARAIYYDEAFRRLTRTSWCAGFHSHAETTRGGESRQRQNSFTPFEHRLCKYVTPYYTCNRSDCLSSCNYYCELLGQLYIYSEQKTGKLLSTFRCSFVLFFFFRGREIEYCINF